ncbi:MAG: DUF1385 domain-containing protein [Lachnospiraceae bacterium]|nr:DUF1385 domain-containing protein [Lachnospiraceae bacterium]
MGRVSIGGQAVIEGIMMKNEDKYAIAVRRPDKEIEVKLESYTPWSKKGVIFRAPIVRGVFNFVESLVIGMKTLMYSAEFYEEEEELKPRKSKKNKQDELQAETNEISDEKKKESSDDMLMFGTVVFSLILAIGLFMLLPAFLASLLDGVIKNHFLLGLIEGAIRLIIFLIYVVLISMMEDIKRTFMYHGAEHKCINCLESGKDLTVENVMEATRFHKRCGTSFLFIVMIVSILVFMCIRTETVWLRLLLRVLLVPVIAGISYEFIRFAGRHDNWIANVLSKPGLWVQKLTTKEPTPDMVEVAIMAVEGVLDWKAYLEEQKTVNEN